jgi:uncharacterized protein (DUF305 family)
LVAACGGTTTGAGTDRGAGTASGTTASRAEATPGERPVHSEADIRFMQGMISHHQQALAMTSLVADRTGSQSIHLLAERIEVSQIDEIAMMSRWLETHPGETTAAGAHDHAGHTELMPGMLSEAELERLAAAAGAAFDRLFLEFMIRHHQGALVMVGQLFATPGAGQEVDVYRIASEVDSDQRIEIRRMERMLDEME